MTSWLRKEQILAAVASGLVGCGGAESMGPSGSDREGNPAVKRIMVKLAKGPDSLTTRIGKERYRPASGPATICGVYVESDDRTGLATRIEPIRIGGRLSQSVPQLKVASLQPG